MMKRLATVAIAVVAMVPTTPGVVHAAAPTALDVHYQSLTSAPVPSMDYGWVHRRIWLEAGTYGWFTYIQPNANGGDCNNRDIYLGAGWYEWADRLIPQQGTYFHDSKLDPDNPAWGTVFITCSHITLRAGYYTWGSALDPHDF
jgi:hypothetical protein